MEGPRTLTADELPQIEEFLASLAPEQPANWPGPWPGAAAWSDLTYRAFCDDDRLLALIGLAHGSMRLPECSIKTGYLVMLGTRKEYRGQGLASLLMDDALRTLGQSGVRLLFVPGIRGLFQRAGCYPAGLLMHGRQSRRQLPPAGRAIPIPLSESELIPVFRDVGSGDGARFSWPEEEYARMLEAKPFLDLLGEERRAWLIKQDGRDAAYVVIGRSHPPQAGRLLEYGGDRRALLGALGLIADRARLTAFDLMLPPGDAFLLDRLRLNGGSWQEHPFPGSLGIIDAIGLWQDLQPRMLSYSGEHAATGLNLRAGQDGAVTLVWGREAAFIQDQERLVKLIFGAGGEPWPGHNLPPTLRSALETILPLPLPHPGLMAGWTLAPIKWPQWDEEEGGQE